MIQEAIKVGVKSLENGWIEGQSFRAYNAKISFSSTMANQQWFTGDGTAYTLSPPSAGNCNLMEYPKYAIENYAALNNVQWNDGKHCSRCAMVYCDDDRCPQKSVGKLVHLMDRCPECAYGDLDLSISVFHDLTGSTPNRYRIRWQFAECPVSGNIKYCLKPGSNPYWAAIQPVNCVTGVKKLTVAYQDTSMVQSAYYYLLEAKNTVQTDFSKVKVTLTSLTGETITDTVSLQAGKCTEGHQQFHATSRMSDTTNPPKTESKPLPTIDFASPNVEPVSSQNERHEDDFFRNVYPISFSASHSTPTNGPHMSNMWMLGLFGVILLLLLAWIIRRMRAQSRKQDNVALPLDTIKCQAMHKLNTPSKRSAIAVL